MIFEHIHFNGLINTSFLNYFIEGFLSETSSSRALAPDCPLYLLSISVSDCLIFHIDSLNFIRSTQSSRTIYQMYQPVACRQWCE